MAHPGGITESFETTKRVKDYSLFQKSDFKNEREMCDLIHAQPDVFAKDVLEITYTGHEREYPISHDRRVNNNWKARVDFKFNSEAGDIYVECKFPRHIYSESNQSVSQILAYSCVADMFKRKVSRYVLVTTRYSPILGMVIRKFKLPIEVYIMNRSHVMKMLDNE